MGKLWINSFIGINCYLSLLNHNSSIYQFHEIFSLSTQFPKVALLKAIYIIDYKIQWVVLVLSLKFSAAFDTVDWSLEATMKCFHFFGSQDVTLFSFIFYFSNFFISVVFSFPQSFLQMWAFIKGSVSDHGITVQN